MKIFSPVYFVNTLKNNLFKKETSAELRIQKPLQDNYFDHAEAFSAINKSLINFTSRKPLLDKMTVLELLDEGKSEQEIAEIMGYATQTVHQHLLKWGIKTKRSIADRNKEQIIELTACGKTATEIAKILGCSVTVVCKAQKNLGISPKNNIENHKEEIVKLYNEGKSQQEIADIINSHQTTVGKALSRWGYKTKVNYAEDNKDIIIALYNEGKGQQEIADIIGVYPLTIRKNLIKWGIELRNPNSMEASKEDIIKLFEEGKDYREIADLMGCNYCSVRNALIRWGVIEDIRQHRTNRPELNKDTIIKLYNEGKSQQEIAKITGCTQPGISKALKLWGLKSGREGSGSTSITEKYKKLIVELYKRGKNITEIASIIGCHYTTIGFALRNWGIKPESITSESNTNRIMELKKAGKTTKEIASIMHCSHSSINKVIRKYKNDENQI